MAVPVLEIGGTHVTGALVQDGTLLDQPMRADFASDPDIDDFVATIATVLRRMGPGVPRQGWGIALPGPFDYAHGIGDFTGVGKFAMLSGVDIRALLRHRLGIEVAVFLNDADAFGLGEALSGAGAGHDPSVYLTLGTGVGSAWIREGQCVHDGPDVPPDGHAYRTSVDGRPLEESMSRRALLAQWQRLGHDGDVSGIAVAARFGDLAAHQVFAIAYDALARSLAPYLRSFHARVVVMGGSIATSFDLIDQHLVPALRNQGVEAPVRPAAHPGTSPLIGAGREAQRHRSPRL